MTNDSSNRFCCSGGGDITKLCGEVQVELAPRRVEVEVGPDTAQSSRKFYLYADTHGGSGLAIIFARNAHDSP